jgi:predicted DNA-binding protein (UPF0251 family)
MPAKRRPQADRRSKPVAKNKKHARPGVSRHDTARKSGTQAPHRKRLTSAQQERRIAEFELLRLKREGLTWKDAENQAGVTRRAAERDLPRAFFHDERGRLRVHRYDPYTRRLRIPTTKPGEFRLLRARGSRKSSLVGKWLNAIKAAGHLDFSLIDALPRKVFVDGIRLATSHYEVSRIAAAAAESDEPFEDIYSLVGAA